MFHLGNYFICMLFSQKRKSPASFKKKEKKPSEIHFRNTKVIISFFSVLFNWSIVDSQYCANLCCTAKWLSYIHTFFMVYYRVLNIIPVLCIKTLLFIHLKDRRLYLPTPHSQSIPLPQPQSLWQPQVWSLWVCCYFVNRFICAMF